MNTDSRIFLRKKFIQYYSRNVVSPPPEIEKREFGVGTLDSKIKIRHKSFQTQKNLRNYLRREAPFYISYSAACYEFPQNQPMSAKNWLGADLIFDLDVDMDFFDSGKLDKVKSEAIQLFDFLVSDFGFSKEDIEINFSGSKGYHLKVANEKVRSLSGDNRREIVDYVTGSGLNLDCFMDIKAVSGLTSGRSDQYTQSAAVLSGPKENDPGWGGRIFGVATELLKSDIDTLQLIDGIGPKKAHRLHEDRERYIKALNRNHWGDFYDGLSPGIRKRAVSKYAVGFMADTDKMVTIDTSRLIRLPDSLHGGSGLIAKRVRSLDSFNPLTDAVAFGDGAVKVDLLESIPLFDLNEQKLSYSAGVAEVPEYIAIYLLLKNKAEIL